MAKRAKVDPETREALSLKKEYDMYTRYATREGAPKIESDYYFNCRESVGRKINWRLLEKKQKKEEYNPRHES